MRVAVVVGCVALLGCIGSVSCSSGAQPSPSATIVPVPMPSTAKKTAPARPVTHASSAAPSSSVTFVGGKTPTEEELVDAPWVRIAADGAILLDGKEIGRVDAAETQMKRIEPLFAALKDKRARWEEMRPGESFPGVLILDVDESVTAIAVKSAFQSAAYAGYPNVSFVAKNKPAP